MLINSHKNATNHHILFFLWLVGVLLISQSTAYSFNQQTITKVNITSGPLYITPTKNYVEFHVQDNGNYGYADLGRLDIVDATGTGAGWDVMVQASQIKEVVEGEEKPNVLPSGSLSLSREGAQVEKGIGAGPRPVWIGENSTEIDQTEPVTILSASKDTGMGSYTITFAPKSLELNIPDTVIPNKNDRYEGTITWTIVQGPS
ncbi:WxL domain-containing protein [Desertibacillus haloalkaliphilus]|uniref:WxL domain-containing protein n=1 Tax=Desertibacillus haloalkaliphilus TaxID=1328930 RepID=UPI001C26C1DE|nr:WxL domain-containing protein [Desertibacillus haloalkaliphilus]MBU8906030.1 WxL domain-containing protein [Desertibacillus haloalkaliphilus]